MSCFNSCTALSAFSEPRWRQAASIAFANFPFAYRRSLLPAINVPLTCWTSKENISTGNKVEQLSKSGSTSVIWSTKSSKISSHILLCALEVIPPVDKKTNYDKLFHCSAKDQRMCNSFIQVVEWKFNLISFISDTYWT